MISDEYDVMLMIKLLEFLITLIIVASCSCESACTFIINISCEGLKKQLSNQIM